VEISHYIAELLFGHDCVVIPGLGAFVAAYRSAQIDENQEIIHPPSRDVTFNPQLKNDDGVLISYIASQEGIPSSEARNTVEQFREDVQYRLEKGDSVVFPELGTLKLNKENQVQFHSRLSENLLPESYGLGSVSLAQEQSGKKRMRTPEKKKNRVWLLFLLIPVVAAAVFVYLNVKTKQEEEVVPEYSYTGIVTDSSDVEEAEVVADSVQETGKPSALPSGDASETVEDNIPEPDSAPAAEIQYHLIGGSFKAQENANNFFEKVKASGYQPVHLGKQGSFYIVAIGSYLSLQEALAAKHEYLDRYPDSGVWIKEADN